MSFENAESKTLKSLKQKLGDPSFYSFKNWWRTSYYFIYWISHIFFL